MKKHLLKSIGLSLFLLGGILLTTAAYGQTAGELEGSTHDIADNENKDILRINSDASNHDTALGLIRRLGDNGDYANWLMWHGSGGDFNLGNFRNSENFSNRYDAINLKIRANGNILGYNKFIASPWDNAFAPQNSWLTDSNNRGFIAYSGSDYAYFGMRQRTENDDNAYNTVLAFGDDIYDDLQIGQMTNSTFNEYMRVTGDGKIGIGTDNPGYDFHVMKSINGTLESRFYNSTSGVSKVVTGSSGGGHITMISNASSNTVYGVPAGESGLVSEYGNMTFATGTSNSATARMKITSGGDVGVGIESPEEKLHVNGYAVIGGATNSTTPLMRFAESSGWRYIQAGSNNNAAAKIRFTKFSSSSEKLTDVEFLTTDASFSDNLAVNGKITLGGNASLADYTGIILGNAEGDNFGNFNGTSYTTEPTDGTLMFDLNWGQHQACYSTVSNYFTTPNSGDDSDIGGLSIWSPNGSNEWEHMLTTYNMQYLDANINSLKSSNDIEVNGTAKVKELHIDPTATWSDFVFEKDYQLPTLTEVESFIKDNGHLPAVPSAKTVATEGYNQTEVNAVLLQKIEELTLYMIEMKKENDQLKAKVSQLSKK